MDIRQISKIASRVLCALGLVLVLGKGMTVNAARDIIVSQTGGGEYITIQDAVDAATDGDTIIIYPGTYDESVNVIGKELNLVGISKELCIIRSDSVSYRQAPLSIAAGTVSNLTITGVYTGSNSARELTQEEIDSINAELALVGDSWERVKQYKGYAVHIDQNYLYGRTLAFENCRIISANSHCVGIGTRGGSAIGFNNCEFISTGEGGFMFLHDSPIPQYGGDSYLRVTNSTITNYLCPYFMTVESLLPDTNTTYFTFQNVKVSTVAYADDSGYAFNNVNTYFDVETLEQLDIANQLWPFTTTANTLVSHLEGKDASDYMKMMDKATTTGDTTEVLKYKLPEGITYIGEATKGRFLKHKTVAVYNSTNMAGTGWMGLDSAVLTADSYGNTMIELNYPSIY